MRTSKILLSLVMVVLVLFALSPVRAQEPLYPIGEVTIEAKTVAAGIGFSWGDGKLKFKGKEYPFKVKGLNVAAVGFAKINAVGDVYNLEKVSDFAGNYVAVEAGLTLAKGAAGLIMRNPRGVVINMRSAQQGVQLSLGVDGFSIDLK